MDALLIKAESKNDLKLISDLDQKLGNKVFFIREEQMEDFALGKLMDKIKTNQNVSRSSIMKKLKK
ncbi:MAG: hypothetical protein Q8K98_12100 [Bacteroidota bacterium]|nr:hypothetical protein [Bacteroidota bacterium]